MSREAFEAWAPPVSEWSQWAKPAPFISSDVSTSATTGLPALPSISSIPTETDMCVVLDLPGPEAVRLAVALAGNGYRPVPLINTTSGSGPAIPMAEVFAELRRGASELPSLPFAEEARPVFVLDSRREAPGYTPAPRTYDNRWMIFPQDFPSGNYLTTRGVRRALVITREPAFRKDLAHVLRRWQEAGVKIFIELPGDGQKPLEIVVERPSMFKLGWYRFLVAIGLKRNSAGGFGGWIPEPSQSRGYG